MKYIRTKDSRIVKLGEQSDIGYEKGAFEVHNFGDELSVKPIFKEDIIKQTNTIEELCDEFVIFYNKSKHKVSVLKTMATARLYYKRDKRYNGNYVDKVYGAIWTDKGLIYVAKMNDKGELELL